MFVHKRDGRLVEFDDEKILESIKKAALAVEGKDDDIQERARQIKNIKNKLIASGFDPDEAEEQAEENDTEESDELADFIAALEAEKERMEAQKKSKEEE